MVPFLQLVFLLETHERWLGSYSPANALLSLLAPLSVKPQLEALEDRTLLDNGFGLILPLGINRVVPTPIRDLSNNAYWQEVSSPITQSSTWLTALAPSLAQSVHFEGGVFGEVDIKPQFLQGQYGTKVQYEDEFTVHNILDWGDSTDVTINGSMNIGMPNTLNVTATGNFTDPSFLGTGLLFKVNWSSNTQWNGTYIVGWSGTGNVSGNGLFFPGDNYQSTLSLGQPQSTGPANLTWQTDTKYNAPGVMTSNDSLTTHLWGAGYIDESSGSVYAQYFNWTLAYLAPNFYASNDKLSINANLSVDQSGKFNGGLSLSYQGTHVFSNNDNLVFYMNIGKPPANWSVPAVIGAQYSLGPNVGVSAQWQGTFGPGNAWGTEPPDWWLGVDFPGNGFKASLQVNPQGTQLLGYISW